MDRQPLTSKTYNLKLIMPFFVSICLIIVVFVVSLSSYMFHRTDDELHDHLHRHAVSYTDLINNIKNWSIDYDNIYVEKKRGVESSQYLRKMGIEPDLPAKDGRMLTMRNHAIIIKEISRRSEQMTGVKFRVVSLTPIDPSNTPDDFEREGLAKLSSGSREFYRLESYSSHETVYRYMTPLYVESSCLECHAGNNYRIGDVIGAVSLYIPAQDEVQEAGFLRILIVFSALFSIGLLIILIYLLVWRLARSLGKAQKQLKRLATTDELTGLDNRRQIIGRLEEEFQRAQRVNEPLSLISLDLDHFKKINDTYGHPFGDTVLQKFAERLRQIVRSYDVVGRVGGEEFLVVAPATDYDEALALAERIVTAIHDAVIKEARGDVFITASAGVAVMGADDADYESILKRADEALYQAKTAGRNRVA